MAGEPETLREVSAWLKRKPAPMPHGHFLRTREQLDEMIESHGLVFFVGPTGVGKTACAEATIARFNACVADVPAELRAAMVTVRTPRAKLFSFKDLWIDVLRALEDPLPERKRASPGLGSGAETRRRRFPGKLSEVQLFDKVRNAARDRGLRVLFVDEAVPLVGHRSPHVLVQTLDVLRDLADGIGFSIVFVATPRILEGLTLSCEFSRRRAIVYFHRYRETDRLDHQQYARAVRSLIGKLPEHTRPKLGAQQHRDLLRGTTGCVGEMFKWLRRAVERCLRAGDKALCWEHFEATVLPDEDLRRMLQQCRDGEGLYAAVSQRTFGADLQWNDEALPARVECDPTPTQPSSSRKTRSGHRIGVPKAKRHRVV